MKKPKSFLHYDEGVIAGGTTLLITIMPVKEPYSFLGYIKWHNAWRKYCFFPSSGSLWDANCLTEVIAKLNQLNVEHKSTRTKKAV